LVEWSGGLLIKYSGGYLTLDRKYMDEPTFKQIYDKATETKKIINALIAYLRKSNSPKKKP